MKIQCKLIREGGTRADIDGIEYHFEPLSDGAQVAEVENSDHIDRFLSISEGYKVYHGDQNPSGTPKAASKVVAPVVAAIGVPLSRLPLAGSELHPPQFDIGGVTFTQREIVEKAFVASGLTSDEWNELGDDDRAARMDITLDGLADNADGEEANDQDPEVAKVEQTSTREELVAQYEAKFGKKPHYKKSLETIRAELEA